MLVYIILLIAIFMYGLLLRTNPTSKGMKLIFLFLSFLSCTLVLGLRGYNVGEDTAQYINIFNSANTIPLKEILNPLEKTAYFTDNYGYTNKIENVFLIWCKVIHTFSNNPQVFLFLTAGLTCFLFAKFIYDNCNEDVFFPTIVFLCESTFMLSINLAREMLACAIALQAYTFLKNQKIWQALVIIFIAITVHNSASITLILIPILLIKPKNTQRVFNFAFVFAVFLPFIAILMQSIISKLFPTYSSYYTKNFYQNSLGFGTILLMLFEIFSIIYMYRKKFIVPRSDKISLIILIYIAFEIVAYRIVMFSRIALYFRVYLMIFFNKVFQTVSPRYKLIIKCILLTLLILFYLSFATSASRNYVFFWN